MNQEERVRELISLKEDGAASKSQISELKNLLGSDARLLAAAREQAWLHTQLSIVFEDEVSAERRQQNIMDAVKKYESADFVDAVNQRLIRRRWRVRLTAVAALFLLSLVAIFYFKQQVFDGPSQRDAMATLERAEGVQWSGTSIQEGGTLMMGASVKIDKGLLEIDLVGKGRLIVEGPAHLVFPEEGRAILHEGSIVMRATEQGHGYNIQTSQGNIFDIGTEFGVSVSNDGLVETHVIDGSIEAISNDGKRRVLLSNDAMKMGPSGGASITADTGQFYTMMPPRHGPKPKFIYWSFNEAQGERAGGQGELSAKVVNQADMILHGHKKRSVPSWVRGPSTAAETALSFDGNGSYAESDYRGIGGGEPRTVCFWLKVPEDFSVTQGFGILSWGNHSFPGGVWQLSANPLLKDGPIGRLRLGLKGGQIIGSSDLRDGKWHHIAVVMYGGSRPNVGTHVILYVDGEQERVSRKALQEVRTEIEQADHGVWLGRNASFSGENLKYAQPKFFRGELDELYIFDAALSQAEVLDIMADAGSNE